MNTQKKVSKQSNYRSVNHVAVTANICERVFSRAKIITNDQRGSMDPSTLEKESLLRYNRDMQDVYLVQEIYESLAQQRNKAGAVQTQAINLDEHLSHVEDSADDDYYG